MGARLSSMVGYADRLLRHGVIGDWPGARNGLQLENGGRVGKIAAAVDAHEGTIRMALEAGADLLVVHHGLFWSEVAPIVGRSYRRLAMAMGGGLAVYASHLPLDLHPVIGNNVLLSRALGLGVGRSFFEEKGAKIGRLVAARVGRGALVRRMERVLGGPVRVAGAGPTVCRRIGVVSGGAGDSVARAAAEGVDTLITGEGSHWTHGLALELGVNILYGGHYATETFGVKALAARLGRRFRLPWVFLDAPSGL
ncbi:MAG: Nif3-like dinuclear metal center hexameric protein [Verrucomicrobiae bacterium]|nr:Nif3-like dinuclear metal center hexameric protein [Verrucomicrobiae bacterium]